VFGILVGLTLRIRGIVADNGIEALVLNGGRGVDSVSFSVCRFDIVGRTVALLSDLEAAEFGAAGRAGRIIGDCHQLHHLH
jgi:hypothetical protein